MFWVLFATFFLLAGILGAYFCRKYIYGNRPKDWKPILTNKNDTWYSMFKDVITRKKSKD